MIEIIKRYTCFDKSDIISLTQCYFENEFVEIVLKCLAVNNVFTLVVPAN